MRCIICTTTIVIIQLTKRNCACTRAIIVRAKDDDNAWQEYAIRL